jgi:hypothetical protein
LQNIKLKNVPISAHIFAVVSDEKYILDICDRLLGMTALRQHKFGFLKGLPSLKVAKLQVDAFYSAKNLVIEYHERQHTEDVAFFNRRAISVTTAPDASVSSMIRILSSRDQRRRRSTPPRTSDRINRP